ncbi:MAG: hypothetical protein ACX939_03240 [Hyphococcus sp.]
MRVNSLELLGWTEFAEARQEAFALQASPPQRRFKTGERSRYETPGYCWKRRRPD